MAGSFDTAVIGREAERFQGEPSRGVELARAMLVMNGQRLDGFARQHRRARTEVQNLPPGYGGLIVATGAAEEDRGRPQRLANRFGVLGQHHRGVVAGGRGSRLACEIEHSPEPESFAARAGRRWAFCQQMRESCGHERQRQDIETVVLEDAGERTGIAGPHEVEVAARNLEAGHVPLAHVAEQRTLERRETTRRFTVRPEPPRGMKHIDVWHAGERGARAAA